MAEPSSYAEILKNGYILGRDFRIAFGDARIERCLVIAPHGGGIEPGTSEIMRAIAAVGGWAWYEFAGFLQKGNKEALHITSTNFDEPTLIDLLPKAGFVLAIHGASQIAEPIVYVGGLWAIGRQIIAEFMNTAKAEHGIRALDAAQGPEHLRALAASNITNHGRRGEGIQLEFSRGARNLLFPPDASREVRGRRSRRMRSVAHGINAALKHLSDGAATNQP